MSKKPQIKPKSSKVDIEQLSALCRLKPTQQDCASFFKCSLDTIERVIREHSGQTFAEFRDENMVHTRFSLVRKAIQQANSGNNIMLIFCLKNLCKWTDKHEETVIEKREDIASLVEEFKALKNL